MGIGGPVFISIGDADKLNVFLDANPWMKKDQMFVDDYSFDAYRAVGFGKFDEVDKESDAVKNFKMTAPDLGFGEWMKYFGVVNKVSPIPKEMKFGQFPEGVLWTGGTFVVQGEEVVYQWTDTIPGNHPVIENVIEIAKDAAKTNKGKKKLIKGGWF